MANGKSQPATAGKNSGNSHAHKIEHVKTESLTPYANNAKKHPKRQVQQIADSIRQFGFIAPIIIDSKQEIVAGHGRWQAATLLGLRNVPIIRVSNLSEAEVKAYRLADNQLTMNTGYDDSLLKIEIQSLIELTPDFELEVTGFETATIDLMLMEEKQEDDPDDEVPTLPENTPVCERGDVWLLGEHRLICGDSRDEATFLALMGDDVADMCFTDPPYNVRVDGHVCGAGKTRHSEFAMASGEMSETEFTEFLTTALSHMVAFSRNGSLHYVCMDWRHIYELLTAGRGLYHDLKNICVWNKDNGGMGSFYRSKHELVAVFRNGDAPYLNTIELGRHGRYRTNVWDYPGVNSVANQKDLAMHPTVKPVALISDAIRDCTRRGHIVLDPFAGSGSTLIASERTGRQARCIEYEPKYCDVIIRRWEQATGKEAILAENGTVLAEGTPNRRTHISGENGND